MIPGDTGNESEGGRGTCIGLAPYLKSLIAQDELNGIEVSDVILCSCLARERGNLISYQISKHLDLKISLRHDVDKH